MTRSEYYHIRHMMRYHRWLAEDFKFGGFDGLADKSNEQAMDYMWSLPPIKDPKRFYQMHKQWRFRRTRLYIAKRINRS